MKLILAVGTTYKLTLADLQELNNLLPTVTEILITDSDGVDKELESWATSHQITIIRFAADLVTYGHSAFRIRDEQMTAYGDALAIFPGIRTTNIIYLAAIRAGIKIFDFRGSRVTVCSLYRRAWKAKRNGRIEEEKEIRRQAKQKYREQFHFDGVQLSRRAIKVLTRLRCTSLRDLESITIMDLQRTPSCGAKTLKEISDALLIKGLKGLHIPQ